MTASRWPWPEPDAPGTFRVTCSCGKWEFVGRPDEIVREARGHDDSPWRNHVVSFAGKVT